jgi:hypothetical protein
MQTLKNGNVGFKKGCRNRKESFKAYKRESQKTKLREEGDGLRMGVYRGAHHHRRNKKDVLGIPFWRKP